jgi:hypothetical protein
MDTKMSKNDKNGPFRIGQKGAGWAEIAPGDSPG